MKTVFYPGAYKPPHRGHFEIVKRLLEGTIEGTVYNENTIKEVTLNKRGKRLGRINKVLIFIGDKTRNGITQDNAKSIWEIYKKYLPGSIEIISDIKDPVKASKEYARKNPTAEFYSLVGLRTEKDLADLKRVKAFKNTPNVLGLAIKSPRHITHMRGADLRQILAEGNLDEISDYFPKELSRQDLLKILYMINEERILNKMSTALDKTLDEWVAKFSNYASMDTPAPTKSEVRADLVELYNKLKEMIPEDPYKLIFNQDRIIIKLRTPGDLSESVEFDYTPYISGIMESMLKEGRNIKPLPKVRLNKEQVEESDFFRPTAHYDPNIKEVTLYTGGRHPKDVMRSFCHEMVHHIQMIEGRLKNIETTDVNEDKALQELEKEAYLEGNMIFRKWEDTEKNKDKKEIVKEDVNEENSSYRLISGDKEVEVLIK